MQKKIKNKKTMEEPNAQPDYRFIYLFFLTLPLTICYSSACGVYMYDEYLSSGKRLLQ